MMNREPASELGQPDRGGNLDPSMFVFCRIICIYTFASAYFARWCTDTVFAQNQLAPLTGFGRRARSPFCKHDRSKK